MPASAFRSKISCLRPRDDFPLVTPEALEVPALLHQLESDRGRIIHSAAIRRLQQKTQVFPLERNAAVRSRLTHSLEVQQAGRYIVRTLFRQLGAGAVEHGLEGLEDAVETLVEMACLMHDIGNPPFGHFGEFAIGQWFARELDDLFDGATQNVGDPQLRARMLADLKAFEGNAQAIRLVVKLLRLNLTYTQTAVLLKYVRPAHAPRPQSDASGAYLGKKPGYYLSEQAFVERMCEALNMLPGTRHPLVYVMEAADDIAYCLADIEDSVEKGILTLEQVAELLREHFACQYDLSAPIPAATGSFDSLVQKALDKACEEPINKVGEFFISLRVSMVHPLVDHAARQFIEHLAPIIDGVFDRSLLEDDSPAHAIVRTFKGVAAQRVFCHPEVETLHLQGYRILQGIFEHYASLLRVSAEGFARLVQGAEHSDPHLPMLVRRLPAHLLQAYVEAVRDAAEGDDALLWEFYHRCRLLQDFVSGMTDQSAQEEYRILCAH